MIKNKRKTLIGIILVFAISLLSGCGTKIGEHFASDERVPLYDETINKADFIDSFSNYDLNDEEKLGLVWMYEEEKLARDIYKDFEKLWSDKLFSDISKSEQNHMDAIKIMFDNYNLKHSLDVNVHGKFSSIELQKLYNELLRVGNNSFVDALIVGAMIEDLDIRDGNDLLKEAKNPDLIRVYNYLMLGSRNHLRAYVDKLKKEGGNYDAKYISPEEYENIISSPYEKSK